MTLSKQSNDNHRLDRLNTNSETDFDAMMSEIKPMMNKLNTYPFHECIHCNIILIGRTRTGKTTLSKVLGDPSYIPESTKLFAETRRISVNRVAATYQDRTCYFTIIDSPGLYDNAVNVGERLTNETIQNYINDCITKDVTDIHAFAFVFSSIGGINNEDIQSMIFIKKKYPNLNKFFLLLITHCEEKDVDERNAFVKEFFRHREVVQHKLEDFFGLGIYFMGCLRPNLRRHPNMDAARLQTRNVMEMRQTLFDFLISRETSFNIHYQPISSNTVLSRISSCCSFLFRIIFCGIILMVFCYVIGIGLYAFLPHSIGPIWDDDDNETFQQEWSISSD